MKRLHALFFLAVLALASIGCHPQPHHRTQDNTTPNSNTAPVSSPTPVSPQSSPAPQQQTKPAPAPLPRNTAQTGPQDKPAVPDQNQIEQRVQQTKNFIAEWVKDTQMIGAISANEFAAYAARVLDDRCYGMLAESDGEQSIHFYNPSTEKAGCIRFATITNADRATYQIWNKLIPSDMPVVYLPNSVTMVFDEEYASQFTNRYLRGLILQKQMIHWKQVQIDQVDPAKKWFAMQLAGYDYQFKLLDKLQLPGYDSFMSAEAAKPQPWNRTPYIKDERIDQMFGKPGSNEERRMLAQLLHFRVMFKKFEQDPKTEVENKARFLGPLL